ncbi:AI-2E family transporter [Confluentibacter citreus]|uniref:AI-2E family transporter n=1 Tax=Confluentibacter citreus TaxID=2007307 RepID=UPI000C290ADA|nr:AI-2E family transporter [Confluentibacter citreus]
MNIISPKIVQQIFTLLLILLLGALIFREMIPYLSGVLGAITIYVLLRNFMAKLVNKGWRPDLAAAFLMFLSFITILVPVAGAILMLSNKLDKASDNAKEVFKVIKIRLEDWENYLGFQFTDNMDASGISSKLTENVSMIAGSAFNTFIAISIMYFLLFYMFTNRKLFRETLIEYIPISKENLKLLGEEVQEMVRSNALGIPLVAIAQGFVALIGFLIFGIESPFFWAVVVTIGSMIPFVGNFLGTIPVFILTLSSGDTAQAWGVLIYGIVIVGTTDNIIRLYVLRRLDNVHPLITLIGVIIGLPLFGFIGLIFGPLLISLFLSIVRIYRKEYVLKTNL